MRYLQVIRSIPASHRTGTPQSDIANAVVKARVLNATTLRSSSCDILLVIVTNEDLVSRSGVPKLPGLLPRNGQAGERPGSFLILAVGSPSSFETVMLGERTGRILPGLIASRSDDALKRLQILTCVSFSTNRWQINARPCFKTFDGAKICLSKSKS